CQALRSNECEAALVAGVNLMLSDAGSVAFSALNALSRRDACRPFDAQADGYVRGEGAGAVVLKRLSRALRDGDRIEALIKGTAVNHDGRSNGLTAPSGRAQEAVIRAALQRSNLAPAQIAYVEAHGTGTPLGDPIEVNSLGRVFGGPERDEPLTIGSVKANIGHLEAAAGIASLIKVVMLVQEGKWAPQIQFEEPNPLIHWHDFGLRVATLDSPSSPVRAAGVSSFGMSGTNAHVVVEHWDDARETPPHAPPVHALVVSARTDSALRARCELLAQDLQAGSEQPADVCLSVNAGATRFTHRVAVVGATSAELGAQLKKSLTGVKSSDNVARSIPGSKPNVAMLLTGQGAQHPGMGRTLYGQEGPFRDALDQCATQMARWCERGLFDILWRDAAALHRTEHTQPALFAFEYSLGKLWQAWGVVSQGYLGHSVGEYAAACLAGVFSLEDAMQVVCARGRLMQALPAGGGMLAVIGSAAAVQALLESAADEVAIAAYNADDQHVLSGKLSALERIARHAAELGLRTQPLNVSHAFHSPLMLDMLGAFHEVCAGIEYRKPSVPVVSNLTGTWATEELATPEYWVKHAHYPVRFRQGLASLASSNCNTYLELGPTPVLLDLARKDPRTERVLRLASQRPEVDGWRQIMRSAAALAANGLDLDWRAVYPNGRRVPLSTYPFERQFLRKSTVSSLGELLGRQSESSRGASFEVNWSTSRPAYMDQHRLFGMPVVAGASHVSALMTCAR
ncbi:MAG TPA: type I polyketide synthase, partial [Polyangiaceae bacterium]